MYGSTPHMELLLELCDISSVDSNQLFLYFGHKHCTFPGSPSLYESDGEILVCTYIILIYCINVASFCGNLHHLPGIESVGVRGA